MLRYNPFQIVRNSERLERRVEKGAHNARAQVFFCLFTEYELDIVACGLTRGWHVLSDERATICLSYHKMRSVAGVISFLILPACLLQSLGPKSAIMVCKRVGTRRSQRSLTRDHLPAYGASRLFRANPGFVLNLSQRSGRVAEGGFC